MAFELGPDLEPIHQPVRLRIMTLLFRERDVGFAQLRQALGVTDGNLGSHAKVLEGHGYLSARRALSTSGFQVRYQITESGARAFREYLASLQIFLEEVGR